MRVLLGVLCALALLVAAPLHASGPLGLYGIVEKVVFEPSEASPERVQVWGAFVYADLYARGQAASPARRGYLYFKKPADPQAAALVEREWSDLKSAAGTGEAVAFGQWGYVGPFGGLDPSVITSSPPYILGNPEMRAARGTTMLVSQQVVLRVRAATDPTQNPVEYQTNTGVVRVPATGSRAGVVESLRALVAKP